MATRVSKAKAKIELWLKELARSCAIGMAMTPLAGPSFVNRTGSD
jgi:hypothetical protein